MHGAREHAGETNNYQDLHQPGRRCSARPAVGLLSHHAARSAAARDWSGPGSTRTASVLAPAHAEFDAVVSRARTRGVILDRKRIEVAAIVQEVLAEKGHRYALAPL